MIVSAVIPQCYHETGNNDFLSGTTGQTTNNLRLCGLEQTIGRRIALQVLLLLATRAYHVTECLRAVSVLLQHTTRQTYASIVCSRGSGCACSCMSAMCSRLSNTTSQTHCAALLGFCNTDSSKCHG